MSLMEYIVELHRGGKTPTEIADRLRARMSDPLTATVELFIEYLQGGQNDPGSPNMRPYTLEEMQEKRASLEK